MWHKPQSQVQVSETKVNYEVYNENYMVVLLR